LDYGQTGDGNGYLQLTHEAVEIVLLRSKARTEPVTFKIPREHNPGLVPGVLRGVAQLFPWRADFQDRGCRFACVYVMGSTGFADRDAAP
jgi:hypothetical protein